MNAWLLLAAAAVAPAAHHPVDRATGTGTMIGGKQTAQPVASIGSYRVPINPDMKQQASVKAFQAGRAMARCIYRRKPAIVASALSAANEADFRSRYVLPKDLAGECLAENADDTVDMMALTFSEFDQVGLLSEAALQKTGPRTLAPVPIAIVPRASGWMTSDLGKQVTLQLATCLAYTQPKAVQELVLAKPGTIDEEAGFMSVLPLVAGCLDKNVTLHATKAMLRQSLAIALYQRQFNAPVQKAAR